MLISSSEPLKSPLRWQSRSVQQKPLTEEESSAYKPFQFQSLVFHLVLLWDWHEDSDCYQQEDVTKTRLAKTHTFSQPLQSLKTKNHQRTCLRTKKVKERWGQIPDYLDMQNLGQTNYCTAPLPLAGDHASSGYNLKWSQNVQQADRAEGYVYYYYHFQIQISHFVH